MKALLKSWSILLRIAQNLSHWQMALTILSVLMWNNRMSGQMTALKFREVHYYFELSSLASRPTTGFASLTCGCNGNLAKTKQLFG